LEEQELTPELAYSEVNIGDEASFAKTITEADVLLYAGLSGDFNPIHIDAEYARESLFKERVAHGMLVSGLISAVLGTRLPGPNSIYLKQDLKFTAPVKIGDTVTAMAVVTEKRDDMRIIKLRTTVSNQRGETVIEGNAVVKKVGL
jgi:3-hydroxybutyryl-CoA dehydratase